MNSIFFAFFIELGSSIHTNLQSVDPSAPPFLINPIGQPPSSIKEKDAWLIS